MATVTPITPSPASATIVNGMSLVEHLQEFQVSAETIEALAEAVEFRLDDMQRAAREMGGTAFTEAAWRMSASLLGVVRSQVRTLRETCEQLEIASMKARAISG